MEGNQVCTRSEKGEQCRDVARAEEDFRGLSKAFGGELSQKLHAPIPPPGAKNRVHFRITPKLQEIVDTLPSRTRSVVPALVEVASESRPESEPFERAEPGVDELLLDRARGCYDPDESAGSHRKGLEHGSASRQFGTHDGVHRLAVYRLGKIFEPCHGLLHDASHVLGRARSELLDDLDSNALDLVLRDRFGQIG